MAAEPTEHHAHDMPTPRAVVLVADGDGDLGNALQLAAAVIGEDAELATRWGRDWDEDAAPRTRGSARGWFATSVSSSAACVVSA